MRNVTTHDEKTESDHFVLAMRLISALAAMLYVVFGLLHYHVLQIDDLISLPRRISFAGVFFGIVGLSYIAPRVRNNLGVIVYASVAVALLDVLIAAKQNGFTAGAVVAVVLAVPLLNILFYQWMPALYINGAVLLASIIVFASTTPTLVETGLFLLASIFVGGGSFGFARKLLQTKQRADENERLYNQLFSNSMEGVAIHQLIVSHDGKAVDYEFLEINPMFESLTGLTRDEVIGRRVTEVLPGIEETPFIARYGQVISSGQAIAFAQYFPPLERHYKVSAYPVGAKRFAVAFEDITEFKRTQEELQASEAKYRSLVEQSAEMIYLHDLDGNILEVNRAAIDKTQYSRAELLHMTVFDVHGEASDKDSVLAQWRNWMATDPAVVIERQHQRKDGTQFFAEVTTSKILVSGQERILALVRDISERKEAEQQIQYSSFHDQLTGLYNRRFFDEELRRLDVARNVPLTLMMLDVNGLKLVNDAFGHDAGDVLLKKAASAIQRVCRADDIIARIGGDEFVVILPQTPGSFAEQVAQRINESLAGEKVEAIPVSVACGWGTKQKPEDDIVHVLKLAEDIMYRHKISERSSLRNASVNMILKTLYEKAPQEQGHGRRVSRLCQRLGSAMGLSNEKLSELKTVGLLHDIGEIAVGSEIFAAQGSLTPSQWLQVRRHPEVGYSILSNVNEYAHWADCVLAHHERWDGQGYPKGTKGEEIPLPARIVSTVNAFDAMTNDRPYREKRTVNEALAEIKVCAGTQFDPDVVEAFLSLHSFSQNEANDQ